jgi:hypothetical protein
VSLEETTVTGYPPRGATKLGIFCHDARRQQEAAPVTHPRTETISSDERPEPVPVDRGPRRVGGPGARLTALTAALSTVLAGGVVTAAYRSFHSGSAAASLVPSTAFAFATVDLGLPGGQADALSAFAGHFPGSPTRTGNGSAVDRILRSMFRGSGNPHLDYDQDFKDWMG